MALKSRVLAHLGTTPPSPPRLFRQSQKWSSRKFICRILDSEVQIWVTEIRIGEILPRSPHPLIIGDPSSFHGLAARTPVNDNGRKAKRRNGDVLSRYVLKGGGNVFWAY
jgi:hypothetical protein